MKRLFVSIVALVILAGSALAQSKDIITVSTSDNLPLLLGSMIGGGTIGALTDAPTGTELDDVSNRGCYTVGYTHFANSRFGYGADLTYAGAMLRFKDKKTHETVSTNSANLFMLMATGKCNYFQKGIFTLGGDAGLGLMSDFKGSTSLAFQVDPIDLRLGSDTAGGFLRIGFGVRGIFTLGFDVAF